MYFEYLIDKTRKTLEGWKSKTLSFGGRTTLIKAVLQSYPIYTLTSTMVPRTVLRRMESLVAQFLWNVKGEARTHWIKWSSICYPILEGGLGFRRLEQIREGLQAKLLWMILSGGSLWAKYMRAKYFINDQPGDKGNASPL